jgi:hypothetical protein
MEKVTGRLLVDLLPNGTVQMAFAPNGSDGNARPLLARTIYDAQSDLASYFEFTPAHADAQIARLVETRHIDLVIAIDAAKVPSIFQAR